jgi:short-subunit dehydrogenase
MLFARQGWRVGLIGRRLDSLAESASEMVARGSLVATAQADVADSVALSDAATSITQQLGQIDVWINCAGNGVYGRFDDVPEIDFVRVTDVTYHGTVNGTRIALSHMRQNGRGTIINVCSAAAFHGLPLMSSYSGAKAAVRAFGEALRAELKQEGSKIRIRSIFPPAVNTPFFSHAISYMGWPARPVGPVYQPEVVAQGLWLAANHGNADRSLSGTAAIFSLACRISPSLIGWCMSRLKFERQSTRNVLVYAHVDPAVHSASTRSSSARGPFSDQARNWSVQVWVQEKMAFLTHLVAFRHWQSSLTAPGLPAKPEQPEPHQVRADLAPQLSDS